MIDHPPAARLRAALDVEQDRREARARERQANARARLEALPDADVQAALRVAGRCQVAKIRKALDAGAYGDALEIIEACIGWAGRDGRT